MNLKFIFIVVAFLLTMYSCKKDHHEISNSATPIPIQLDAFPLAIGNAWKYHSEITLLDSIGQIDSTYEYDNTWEVISDTVINGWNTTKVLHIDSNNYNGSVHVAHTYYANRPDGFYGVAVENYGSMLFSRDTNFNLFPSQEYTFSSPSDSIFIPVAPLQFLKFPTQINDTWDVVTYIGTTAFYRNRIYTNFQTVNTTAGSFNCIRLKSNFEQNGILDTSITIYQDISVKGFIAETLYANVIYAGGGSGRVIRSTRLVQINF